MSACVSSAQIIFSAAVGAPSPAPDDGAPIVDPSGITIPGDIIIPDDIADPAGMEVCADVGVAANEEAHPLTSRALAASRTRGRIRVFMGLLRSERCRHQPPAADSDGAVGEASRVQREETSEA
jgi:hypothetical protein